MNLKEYLRWLDLPLCLLNPKQQIQVKDRAEICIYTIGDVIWSTDNPGSQFLLVSGNVRLSEEGRSRSLANLTGGNWFGDLLGLSGQFYAVAKQDVVVVRWSAEFWTTISSVEINYFWFQQRSRYQGQDANFSQPVSGYPFVLNVNSAAACLTMAAQYLQIPVQLDAVQRHMRGIITGLKQKIK